MYVVIGANGFVGSYVVKNILERTDEQVLALGRNIHETARDRVRTGKCDITDTRDVKRTAALLAEEKELKAVYLAAYHHPDEVKKDPRSAWNVNITALSYFLNAMPRFQCLFYASTEMVYGACGLDQRFKESDRLAPVNVYGRHKEVAERIVLGYGYNVARFPFMIGRSLLPGKKHFYDEIVDSIRGGIQRVEMFADAYKTALDFNTAARLLVCLMESFSAETPKILNIAGDDVLSKYEIGLRIAQENGLNTDLIVPVRLRDDHKIFTENRADCTLLDNSLVKKTLDLQEIRMRFK